MADVPTQESEGKKPLIELIYEGAKDVLTEMKKPFFLKGERRKYEQARDDAEMQKIDAQNELNELREMVKEDTLNRRLEQHAIIESADKTIAYIEKEYEEMFGKKMK